MRAKRSRWSSGICTLCGKRIECITFAHAAEHGFSHPDEMVKAKVVKFDNFCIGGATTKKQSEIHKRFIEKVGVDTPLQGRKI